ncbi:MAG: hypothetical protein WCK08_11590 [Betaproteobacteria bacterium]
MNTHVDLTLSLAADGSALPSLFFRPADRLRLEGCVAALTQEGRSLAMSSEHEAALDHYGKLLTERLRRAAPQSQVETYFPASTDALVARFNEVLAGQTMKEAMTEGMGRVPERIWVVHDAGALAEHELQLLARLVSNFPGANIRAVLLLGPALRSRKAFESLGRRFVRWDIEAPTPEQAQAMLSQARIEGCESLVTGLLRHLQPVVLKAATPALEPFSFSPAQDRPQVDGAARQPARAVLAALTERARQLVPVLSQRLQGLRKAGAGLASKVGARRADQPARKGIRWPKARWIMAVAGLAALSVAVSAWLNGGRFGVSKPAGAQPVKDVRSGAEPNSPIKAVDLLRSPAAARESKT